MYQTYQRYKIAIYYTQKTKNFIGWAKTFWLLKTAHPVITVEIDGHYLEKNLEPYDWLNTHLPHYQHLQALFVPATIRPLVDIDFLTDSHAYNRYSTCLDGSLCICRLNEDPVFKLTDMANVFEDLCLPNGLATIEEEIALIKEKLLMNI